MKRSILLLISHNCNLACRYCYERFKDSRKMSVDDALEILEAEFSDNAEEITNVDLLGGEPLSNYPVIPHICNWIWARYPKMQVFVRTNGTLLSEEMKVWFSNHSRQIGLGLSIDGTPETNYFNRGVKEVDLDFFKKYWPDVPVKITVFPQSVDSLFMSLVYLYEKGLRVTGGLAQGVKWDERACSALNIQMEKLVDYYLANTEIFPLEPLFSLNFEHAFESSTFDQCSERPCWERQIVHTYDCDKDMLPCHMFSTIVQGREKRASILKEAAILNEEQIDTECRNCPIRWSCSNCMAMNYQHFGTFEKNANRLYSCSAHKILAYWSAHLLALSAMKKQIDLSDEEKIGAIRKAIDYIKVFEYGK